MAKAFYTYCIEPHQAKAWCKNIREKSGAFLLLFKIEIEYEKIYLQSDSTFVYWFCNKCTRPERAKI